MVLVRMDAKDVSTPVVVDAKIPVKVHATVLLVENNPCLYVTFSSSYYSGTGSNANLKLISI